jgi:hypothetical protein
LAGISLLLEFGNILFASVPKPEFAKKGIGGFESIDFMPLMEEYSVDPSARPTVANLDVCFDVMPKVNGKGLDYLIWSGIRDRLIQVKPLLKLLGGLLVDSETLLHIISLKILMINQTTITPDMISAKFR